MYQERPARRYLWQWSGVGRWINRSDIDRTELGGDMQQCRSREHVIPATRAAGALIDKLRLAQSRVRAFSRDSEERPAGVTGRHALTTVVGIS